VVHRPDGFSRIPEDERSIMASVDMGANFDRSNGTGERGTNPAPSPASAHPAESVPDFRGLLRRAAMDLRSEAAGKAKADQRERLLRLAAMLDQYAEDAS
jgi:hypothetical protein